MALLDFLRNNFNKVAGQQISRAIYTDDGNLDKSNPDKITYAVGVVGNVSLVDDSGNPATSSGSSTGISVEGIVVGSQLGSYTFDASAQTITLTGLPTIELRDIGLITNLTDGVVIYNPQDVNKLATISGNVITLAYDTTAMSDTDELQIPINYNNSQDYTLSSEKTIRQNPDYAHETDPELLVDETNQSANTYFKRFTADTYNHAILQEYITTSGTDTNFKLYATLDSTATEPSAGGTPGATWVDVSTEILGASSVDLTTGQTDMHFIDTAIRPYYWLLEYTIDNATNATKVWFKKFY